jgi:predicted GNAT family N-acyltransferase
MNKACPHIIATIGQQVIGYALCMHPKFSDEIAVLKPMFKKIHEELGTAASFIAMGQICVQAGYRGQGIFRGLYTHMCTVLQAEFNRIITEVDVKNTRSLQAHYAVGFEKLIAYEADGHQWELIQLEFKKSSV